MDAPKVQLKSPQATVKIQLPQFDKLCWVDLHLHRIVEVYQSGVIRAVICWGERKAVANIVGAFGRADGQNMSSID
jgi:hypothetical protein